MQDSAGFDAKILADKTIEMLSILPGQVIWIWVNIYMINLIEALAYRIRARGAFWLLSLNSKPLLRRIGLDLPEEHLPLMPEHELRWLDDMDAIIEIQDHAGHIPGVPLECRSTLGAERIALINEAARKGIRRVTVIHPMPALATAYSLSLDELQRRVMRAVKMDYSIVDRRQEQIARLQGTARQVHITSVAGTDLYLRVTGRKSLLDTDSIPHGELYIAPLEDSAEGVAVIEKAFFRGRFVEKMRLTFSDGCVIGEEAPDPTGVHSFRELLDASSGDKDWIAEFAIRANPGVVESNGYIPLDEKIGGSLQIAIGMNDRFGGKSASNLHQDFVIPKPTVLFDETVVL